MKFYKMTFSAKTEINTTPKEEDSDFEVSFWKLPGESIEQSSGNVLAFLSGYCEKSMHISAAVQQGDMEDYLPLIQSFLPDNISSEALIEEVTCKQFDRLLHFADHLNMFDSNEVREHIGIGKLFDGISPNLRCWSEQFIEEPHNEIQSQDLAAEVDRIRRCGKPTVEFNPVHYIIGGVSLSERRSTLNQLLYELKQAGRINQSRYTVLHVKNSRVNPHLFADLSEEWLHLTVGGAIVFNLQESLICDNNQCSETMDKLMALRGCLQHYGHNTLFIFLLPDNAPLSAQKVESQFKNTVFVELLENTLDGEAAKVYLSNRAKADKIRTNQSLYVPLESGTQYYTGELDTIYEDWYGKTMVHEKFPAYQSYYEQRQSKKNTPKEVSVKSDAYDELMNIIGLAEAKQVINDAIDYFKAQRIFCDLGFAGARPSMHMIFSGAPGTAKTSVARLFAKIMKDNQILSSGTFVEVGRSDLVGKYVGWTAKAVKEKFEEASGGVLFIDEAYSLVDDRNGSFGDEAINTIVQEMENHRNDVIVIFAGYADKMDGFIKKNPGLRSRIAFHVSFADYSADELFEIAELMATKSNLVLSADVKEKLLPMLKKVTAQSDFGNGRFVRNLLEQARMKQASRLIRSGNTCITREQVRTLIFDDFERLDALTDSCRMAKAIGF